MEDYTHSGILRLARHLGVRIALATLLLGITIGCGEPQTQMAPSSPETINEDTGPSPIPEPAATAENCDEPVNATSAFVNISSIEAIQAISTSGQLLPGDSTAVIAYVEPLTDTIALTGTLTVCADGQVIESILASRVVTASTAVSVTDTRLVFEPLFLPESANIDFRVEVALASAADNVLVSQVLSDVQFTLIPEGPKLFYVRIDLREMNPPHHTTGNPPFDLVNHPGGDAFARAVLPISESGWFYRAANNVEVQGPALNEIDGIGVDVSSIPATATHVSPIIHAVLAEIRNRIVFTDGLGANETTFVHGWIAENAVSGVYGAATGTGSRVGYSTANQVNGQLMYVHELLHNVGPDLEVGLDHVADPTTATTGITGWDVASHLPSGWASGLTEIDQWKGSDLSPIMAYQNTAQSWISKSEYERVVAYFSDPKLKDLLARKGCSLDQEPIEQFAQPCLSGDNIILSGILSTPVDENGLPQQYDPEATEQIELIQSFPVKRAPALSQPTYTYSNYSPEEFPLQLVFRSEADPTQPELQIPFDARLFIHPVDRENAFFGDEVYLGYFEVVLPKYLVDNFDSIDIQFRGQRLPYFDRETLANGLVKAIDLRPIPVP